MLVLTIALLAAAAIAMAYFAIDAVRTENPYQLAAYVATSTVLLLASSLPLVASSTDAQSMSHSPPLSYIAWACLPTLGVLQLLNFALGYATYRGTTEQNGLGMRRYKKVGTDPLLIRLYGRYQAFCSLLKFDLLLQLALLTFTLIGMPTLGVRWWLSLLFHLPVAVIWLPLGLAAVRREWWRGTLVLALVASLQPILFVVQLVLENGSPTPAPPPHHPASCESEVIALYSDYATVFYTLVALGMCCRLLFLASLVFVWLSYGRGLRERVHSSSGADRLSSLSSAWRSTLDAQEPVFH